MAKSRREPIALSDGERERLESLANHPATPRRHAWRARIVPGPGAGCTLSETMRRTGMSKPTVWAPAGPLP